MQPVRLLVMAATLWLLTSGYATAQVRKCTSLDGKVTYSDFVCASNATEHGVTVNANSIDASSWRKQTKKTRTDDAVEKALQENSGQCKFSSYVYGDSKGKILADAAKEECLRNIAAKASGQTITLDAYNMWKDHSTQKDASRRAAVTRAADAANAQAIANSNRNAINEVGNQINNKTYTCKPNLLGNALNCN